jgi:hypothetical protein
MAPKVMQFIDACLHAGGGPGDGGEERGLEKGQGEGQAGKYIGLVCNSYSRAGLKHPVLFRALSGAIQKLLKRDGWGEGGGEKGEGGERGGAFDSQAISNILNAYAGLGVRDLALFSALASVIRATPPEAFTPQAISTILNSCVRVQYQDEALFKKMAAAAKLHPPSGFTHQTCALILNAFTRAGQNAPEDLQRYLAAVIDSLEPQNLSPQALATIVNAYTRATPTDPGSSAAVGGGVSRGGAREKGGDDEYVVRLLLKLARASVLLCDEMDLHAISVLVNAFARTSHWRRGSAERAGGERGERGGGGA